MEIVYEPRSLEEEMQIWAESGNPYAQNVLLYIETIKLISSSVSVVSGGYVSEPGIENSGAYRVTVRNIKSAGGSSSTFFYV